MILYLGISLIRLKTANQRFGLDFKPGTEDYKSTTNIKSEKRLARLGGREPEEEEIGIPPIQVSARLGCLCNAL
jgi:hypothetical protein